ncbi:unnamed protein product [Phytomonas sp. EM1]|nr:unnamed protein product [Phytomonas sp. EM1]|eukprot:CCW60253.1 unnamed protein product [Phytomonas sp. isolate EM1]
MSCFFLKQLNAGREEDKPLLDLFQHCRERVVRVTSTHYLPNHIAVTTQNGFIEFIDVCNGEFRLFLTHLEHHIPLESPVRCISLVPSYFSTHSASRESDLGNCGPQLLYSLGFSNELLLANLETGVVSVLDRFNTRPSALFCDEDYIALGEGGGQVSVWDLSHERRLQDGVVAHPKLLWKKLLLEDTVVCLKVHHERLVCCSADHHFCVLLVDTGECLMTWVGEPDPVVDILLFENPSMQHLTTVICLSTCFSIFTETELNSSNLTVREGVVEQFHSKWKPHRRFALDNVIQCATCFGNYLVAGTASGMVLLYYFSNLEDGMMVLARFDVGYSVVRVQLYADETLLVVSSAGDVWKWPLADLISESDKGNMSRGSGIPSRQGQDDLRKPTGVPAVLNSTLADESQYTFSDCAETLAGEGGRESSVRLEDDYKSHDVHDVGIREEGEQQRQPSIPSALITESPPPKQIELPGEHDEMDEVVQKSLSQTALSVDTPNVQPTSMVNAKTQPCLIGPPLERTVYGEETMTLVVDKLQDLKDVMKFKSSLPPSNISEEEGSVSGEEGEVHQDNLETATACSASRDISDHLQSGSESNDHAASVAVESEPEVVLVEEENLMDTSTNSISSSLSPRSDRPPQPVPEERNTDEEHTVDRIVSQPLEEEMSTNEKSPTTQPNALSNVHGDHDNIPPSDAVVRVTRGKELTQASSLYSPERELSNFQAMLGPPAVISGLRKGRRMDPRQIYQILKNESQSNESGNAADGEMASKRLQSTAMILEQQDALRKSTFHLESYVKEHPLEAEALPYHYPVKLPTYSLEDRVFGDAVPPIIDGGNAAALRIKADGCIAGAAAANLMKAGWSSVKPALGSDEITDDLMDATRYRFTRKRDLELIEERRRGGPDINAHPCEDILYPATDPSSTVLFKEYQMQPSEQFELLLPMPLPALPSVF